MGLTVQNFYHQNEVSYTATMNDDLHDFPSSISDISKDSYYQYLAQGSNCTCLIHRVHIIWIPWKKFEFWLMLLF